MHNASYSVTKGSKVSTSFYMGASTQASMFKKNIQINKYLAKKSIKNTTLWVRAIPEFIGRDSCKCTCNCNTKYLRGSTFRGHVYQLSTVSIGGEVCTEPVPVHKSPVETLRLIQTVPVMSLMYRDSECLSPVYADHLCIRRRGNIVVCFYRCPHSSFTQ